MDGWTRLASGRWSIALAVAVVAGFVCGCSPSMQGGPQRLETATDMNSYLARSVSKSSLEQYRTAYGVEKRELRNSIVLSSMALMDIRYTKFEKSLTRERQQAPFVATLASIGLSGAGTIVADAATKTVLAAVDTALKGTREAYDKEILASQTISFIQTQMRTNRNEVRARIVLQLATPIEAYPLELAILDLEDYYAAGTITAGLVRIGGATATRLAESEDLKILSSTTFGTDDASLVIRRHLESGGEPARRAMVEWLRVRGIPAFVFLNAAEHAALRAQYAALIRNQ
jgi:hypothetical protein